MHIVLFLLLLILSLSCAPSLTKNDYPSAKSNYAVIGVFDNYNEVFRGTIYEVSPYGETYIEMKGNITGMKCAGNSYTTHIPRYSPNCLGMEGKANLTCDDGRKIEAIWSATGCRKGIGKGADQNGNTMTFAYGMSESEASKYIQKLAQLAYYKPILPSVYRPKETRKEKGFASGTGFFVTDNGYMITNYHIIEGSKEIFVIPMDGSILKAKFIKGDPANDIALIKINIETKPLKIYEKGSLSKGEEVFTLGYPLLAIQGQEQKATFGRINSLSGIKGDIRFCQIDIPVQPGNSGGPLFNKNGQVVGVITATLDEYITLKISGHLPQNVNYAVKSDYIIPVIRDLLPGDWHNKDIKRGKKDFTELIKLLEPSVALVVSK